MGVTYSALYGAFFPHAFVALTVCVVPSWDDVDDALWLGGEPTETMTDLDASGVEEFSPMPGYDD